MNDEIKLKAARIEDKHLCPAHAQGHIMGPGASTVIIDGLIGSRAMDTVDCNGTPNTVLFGSPLVYSGGGMSVRLEDPTKHGGKISGGTGTVEIGGPTAQVSVSGQTMKVVWGGMTITGSVDDVATFTRMLHEDATYTDAGRRHLASVISDTTNPITLEVGRNQAGTLVDNFSTNTVDLDDLGKFPPRPSPDHPNEHTRGEYIHHFIAERHSASITGSDFDPAHQSGIDVQNQIRTELGQTTIASQEYEVNSLGLIRVYPDQTMRGIVTYADGSTTTWVFDNNFQLIGLGRPP